MVNDHWFRQVGKILEAMQITSDATRTKLAAFQLEGDSQVLWDSVKGSRNLEATTWEEFRELFMGKILPIFCPTCKSSGVPRTKTRDDDKARIRG